MGNFLVILFLHLLLKRSAEIVLTRWNREKDFESGGMAEESQN